MSSDGLNKLTEEMKGCVDCKIHEKRIQVVPGIYGKKNGLCLIGGAPGANEDRQGIPFIGRSGKLLDRMFSSVGLVREKDFSILNVVKCRPTTPDDGNRTPTMKELRFCGEKWLYKQLDYLKPKLLVSLGSISMKFFFPKEKITQVAGTLKRTNLGYPLFITFHPAYILRNPQPALLEKYESHFHKVADLMKQDKIDDFVENEMTTSQKKKEQKPLNDFLN